MKNSLKNSFLGKKGCSLLVNMRKISFEGVKMVTGIYREELMFCHSWEREDWDIAREKSDS
jgi:hypothetical protein